MGNYLKDKSIVNLSITIIDGMVEGDKLTLAQPDDVLSYKWDNTSKILSLEIQNDKNIKHILSSVMLDGKEAANSRLLEAKIFIDQSQYVLQEYSLFPSYHLNLEENHDLFHNGFHEELDLSLNLPNISYSDVKGADFLNIDMVEALPYFLNKNNNSDVYTILKNEASDKHNIEIWGYNLSQDKIDLNNFAEDLRGVHYQILGDQDLQLSIYNSEHEYSIILKEVASMNAFDTLDDIIQNLVLNIEINKGNM